MILLRDDDANATTEPAQLARAYAPLLDARYPINFAVIPEVALDTCAPGGRRERFIDESAPHTSATLALQTDSSLAVWLKSNASDVEVLQHGHTHRRGIDGTEFGGISHDAAAHAIERGAAILEMALGRRPIAFVPPWDVLSRGAVQAAVRTFALVSCWRVSRQRLPISAWPAHLVERTTKSEAIRIGDCWLLRHRGDRIGADLDPAEVPAVVERLTRGARVGVITLHHWRFWERGEPHPVIVALARALRGKRVGTVRHALASLETGSRWLGSLS
jgi:hypothetical protein